VVDHRKDLAASAAENAAAVPPGIDLSANVEGRRFTLGDGKLRDLVAYARKVFDLRRGLEAIEDDRQDPKISTALIAASVFFCGLLRFRSFNALEPKLRERTFRRLVGAPPEEGTLGSVDTVSRVLRKLDVSTVRALSVSIVAKAERNKVFREGWHGALHAFAIDGWEPICSYHRHCDQCLVRHVRVERGGEVIEVEQYYHRFVVAMLIDERFDMALDIEPLLPHDLRPPGAAKDDRDEGELTAAIRLLRRVKQTYGWLELVVADGLYPNGPFLTAVQQLRLSAVIIARKDGDEPLKEALAIWGDQPPQEIIEDKNADERIELWDCREIRTLNTYGGPIRVVRGRVTDTAEPTKEPSTWCIVATGVAATRLSSRQVLATGRGRWHIENTGFHQWTTCWHFAHVFVHDANGILALYWLFFAAFNLLTLFLYRQVRSYGRDRGKDVTRTISRFIDEMLDDLARLDSSPWDTS
jgi:hypothetical protein